MAEAIGRAEVAARLGVPYAELAWCPVEVLSAGVTATPGAPITADAAAALTALGVPVHDHRSRLLTAELVERAEVVYCATRSLRDAVLRLSPSAAGKTRCLDPDGDIPDPIGATASVYAEAARRIQELVRRRFDELGFEG
jgi:protein-tyrosine-phosphatase